MENAAHHHSHTHAADDSGTISGKLPLTAEQPTEVWIGMFTKGGETIAGFAASSSGPFYRGGIEWSPSSSEYGLFVTFALMPGVDEIDCDDLLYSPVGNATQLLAIPPQKGSYDFNVTFTSGAKHDPKIVVTPITMPDPNC